jgi:hypothetical protein
MAGVILCRRAAAAMLPASTAAVNTERLTIRSTLFSQFDIFSIEYIKQPWNYQCDLPTYARWLRTRHPRLMPVKISTNGIQINVEDRGRREPVLVFLHY